MAALLAPNPTATLMKFSIFLLSITSSCIANLNSSSTGLLKLAIPGIFYSNKAFIHSAVSVAPLAKFKCPRCPLNAVIIVFLNYDLSASLSVANYSLFSISI
jgi:hypothetical protein